MSDIYEQHSRNDGEALEQLKTARDCLIDGTEAAEVTFTTIHTDSQIAIGVDLDLALDTIIEEGRHDGRQWVVTGSIRIVLCNNSVREE